MKRFTLGLLAAFCCLMGHATVSSVDDLVGTYTGKGSGWEALTDYENWTALSSGYNVTISKNSDGTVGISNLLNFKQELTGTVDISAKTITIAPSTYYSYYTFADATDATKSVVGEIADDGSISFSNFGAWYSNYSYIYAGATLTLTKEADTEVEWTVDGTINYTDDSKDGAAYYTGKTTLTKYSGSEKYDYGLKFDGPDASPSELKFKIYADKDSIGISNGEQYTGYAGAYFYSVYADNYMVYLEAEEGEISFSGDQTGGEFKVYCYSYASKSTKTPVEGFLTFTWGTAAGITASPIAAKTTDDAPVYDLSGRKVSSPSAGIYIQNGKKFVVK